MTARVDDEAWEARLAAALRGDDPIGEVSLLASQIGTTVDPRGVRIAALLIARLRFERVVQGSPRGEAEFTEDPRTFTDAFRRYHAQVPATSRDAAEEWAAFDAWRRGEGST